MGSDVAEHFVEMPDAPRLAHDPRVQVQHHQPSGRRAVGVQTVEPLAPQQVDLVDGAPPVQVDVVVVEVRIDPERIELAGFRRHLVGLLVVAPVADVADTCRGEQVGVFGVSWKSGPDQPTGRVPVACSTAAIASRIYCRSSSSDMPMWMMCLCERPCAMNSASRR